MSKQITLIDRLQEQASIQPNKRAFTFLADGDTEIDSLTYQQLDEKAKAIALVLQNQNAPGERALLLYQPGLDFITAFLGCLYAGVIAVPVYPPRANRSLERLLAIVSDASASFALTTKSIQEQVASKFANHHATEKIKFIASDTLEIDLARGWQYPAIATDSLAFLQYTSGSTGKPKGVMVSHGNLMANSQTIQHSFGNEREHTLVSWLPPYHDMGLIGSIIQPAYVGSSMYLMAPLTFLQRPYRWLQAISNYRGQTNGGPNFAYELCVDRITLEQKATLDLSCWELAFSGAETVRAETIDRFSNYFRDCGFRRQVFYPCYGMAESTLMITGNKRGTEPVIATFDSEKLEENQAISPQSEVEGTTLVSSGRNAPGQNIIIANPETRNQCPDGEIGEIWARSPSVAQGYWNRPELTLDSFDAVLANTQESGWLRTGDLGFLQDGELFVTGRLKDLIIIRGRNYYPQDIELSVDNAHEAIRGGNVAAFAVEVAGKERLVVTPEIKRTHLRKLNAEEVTKAIISAVYRNHELRPHGVVLLKTGGIPKTSSGKIQRHACKAGYLDRSLNAVGEYFQSTVRRKEGSRSDHRRLAEGRLAESSVS
ncbi:MAG: fatty acyl-AMP ligase [Waterburya sp.]